MSVRTSGRTGFALLVVGAGLHCVVTRGDAADWPQWLGPTRNGRSPEIVAPWTEAPRVVWRQPAGSGFASPVTADGRVFLHRSVIDKEAEAIVAYDVVTGEEVWTARYDRAAYRSELGVGPRSTPAVADGWIYTIGITGVLSCHNAATGERRWQANPYEALGASLPTFGACSSPVVAGDKLIVLVGGAGNGVLAYNVETGEIAWKALDEPAGTSSPVVRQIDSTGVHEVIVQTSLRLAGLDVATGDLNWAHPLVFEPSGVAPTPLLSGSQLLCATQDTGVVLIELPKAAGAAPEQKWWNEGTSTYFSTGAVAQDGQAFVVTNSLLPLPRADVTLFTSENAEPVWTMEGLGYFHVGLIALHDGALLLLDDAGNLKLLRPGAGGLEELATAKICGGTFASPALSNGRLLVRDNTELLCVELSPTP